MVERKKLLFSRNPVLAVVCAVLSVFTLACFHAPFFRYVLANVSEGFNGTVIVACLVVIMLLRNFFFYYLMILLGVSSYALLFLLPFLIFYH